MIKVNQDAKITDFIGKNVFVVRQREVFKCTIGKKNRTANKVPFFGKVLDGMYTSIDTGMFYTNVIAYLDFFDGEKYLFMNKFDEIFDNELDANNYAIKKLDEEIEYLQNIKRKIVQKNTEL